MANKTLLYYKPGIFHDTFFKPLDKCHCSVKVSSLIVSPAQWTAPLCWPKLSYLLTNCLKT